MSKYFSESETACKCCGVSKMDSVFMTELDNIRSELGIPLILTSAYRCPTHNAEVSSTGQTGPHTTGRAVDITISGNRAFQLVSIAKRHGFTGIGIKQHGPHDGRFIHLDNLPNAPGQPRPWVWSYP